MAKKYRGITVTTAGAAVYKGCRAAAVPEILRKYKLNILIKVFVRRYIHSLKEYE
jgi:hypothetical protein